MRANGRLRKLDALVQRDVEGQKHVPGRLAEQALEQSSADAALNEERLRHSDMIGHGLHPIALVPLPAGAQAARRHAPASTASRAGGGFSIAIQCVGVGKISKVRASMNVVCG